MNSLPSLSILTVTYNSDLALFEQVLIALRKQDYPKKLIEHIVMDAGSTNGAIKLAEKYGCKVYVRPDLKVEEHMRAGLGFKIAKNKIVLIIQSDNLVTSSDWLKRMVQPFMENKDIFCAYTAHYSYKKNMSATTRYGALIGANDPLISPYFLDKIEKVPMTRKKYNKGKIIEENKNYYTVRFNNKNCPPLGDNGQMVLRSVINKVNKDPKNYMHLDTWTKMFDLGYTTCGVVKTSVIHVITPDIYRLATRRVQIKENFFDGKKRKRRFLVYDSESIKDKFNLAKFVLYSATFIPTIIQCISGYLKIRDKAWFLHPVICFVMLAAYSVSEIKGKVKL